MCESIEEITVSGFGVFATKSFSAKDFILDYVGKLVNPAEEDEESNPEYCYYFKLGGKNYWYVSIL
jgi:SET domain-containing protein